MTPHSFNREDVFETELTLASKAFHVPAKTILSTTRRATAVRARHVAMWLSRGECQYTLQDIGWFFKRDHATVLHAVRKVGQESRRDPDFRNLLASLTAERAYLLSPSSREVA